MASSSADCHNPGGLRFLRMAQVADKVGLHQRTIWRKIRDESFPKPVPLGGNSVGFVEAEVEEWMRARMILREAGRGRDV